MNLMDLDQMIYVLCEENEIEDADELDELYYKIVDTVANALVDYAKDNDIDDFNISYYRR